MEKNLNILVDNLIRGMDCANRLQNLICGKMNVDELISLSDLVMKISQSFSVGLLILNGAGFGVEASLNGSLASSIDRVSDVSTSEREAGEREAIQPTIVKKGRGRYKRRKSTDSWEKISSTTEDAYKWRKYGQKQIQNSKFPRCYYRCAYMDDNGCMATKYFQRLENQSNKFKITYHGHHTCSTSTPHIVSYPGPGRAVLDFEGFKKTHGQYSTSNPSAKRIKSLRNQQDQLSNDKDLSRNAAAPSSRSIDVLIDESRPCNYEASGSSTQSNMRRDLLGMDGVFENGDFFNETIADDVFFMPQTLWDMR